MKAKEYYEKYNKAIMSEDRDISNKALSDVFFELAREIPEIAKNRNTESDSAVYAIIKEIDAKYRAFCRLFNPPILNQDGFKSCMNEAVMQELKGKW